MIDKSQTLDWRDGSQTRKGIFLNVFYSFILLFFIYTLKINNTLQINNTYRVCLQSLPAQQTAPWETVEQYPFTNSPPAFLNNLLAFVQAQLESDETESDETESDETESDESETESDESAQQSLASHSPSELRSHSLSSTPLEHSEGSNTESFMQP